MVSAGGSFFQQLFNSIAESGRELVERQRRPPNEKPARAAARLCHALLSQRGEAAGAALAIEALAAYNALDADGRSELFAILAAEFAPEADAVMRAAEAYRADPSPQNLTALSGAVEAPRQELFRRLNMAPGGTAALVQIRAAVLDELSDRPELAGVDADLRHLFSSWFNRGFLTLKRIDWGTPAVILEKLITYETVHAIAGWDDLRRRIANDRRCFAFFHPALPDEPLIFVEVALVKGLAQRVQALLDQTRPPESPEEADSAIFYSINNCQAGLRGVSFGAFLIKQVAAELSAEFPNLKSFATLSPIPGFRRWLATVWSQMAAHDNGTEALAALTTLEAADWHQDQEKAARLERHLMPLCAWYLTHRAEGGHADDPVARFHLGKGARLERINWLGDVSDKGIRESAGMMVNYLYRLDQIERNHEAYVNGKTVVASRPVRALARTAPLSTPEKVEDEREPV